MGTTLDDHIRESERARADDSRARREVFGRAYSLAAQLMELRMKRGLTQQELGNLTGIAQSEISRIERGVISPTDRTIMRLAEAMGAEIRLAERSA